MTLAQQRRDEYERTHDIYGNDLAMQREIEEIRAENRERARQTVEAFRLHLESQTHDWFRPMGVDEHYVPGTKQIFDYGRLPDNRDFSSDEPPQLHRSFD